MGIYLCEHKPFYDIKTKAQGTYFLVLGGIFILLEFYYIYQTIMIFRKLNLRKTKILVTFYISIHIVLLRGFFLCLGGVVICYKEILYLVIANYFSLFKDGLVLFMTYRIGLIIKKFDESSKIAKWFPMLIVIIFIAIVVLMTIFFGISHGLSHLKSYYIYCTIASHAILMIIFNIYIIYMFKLMNNNSNFNR